MHPNHRRQACRQVKVRGLVLDREGEQFGDVHGGVTPGEALPLAQAVAALPRLQLRGVMALPAPSPDPAVQAEALAQVRVVFEQLRAAGLPLDVLSMGMSADLEAAVAQGSTMVRVGTALFGQR
jgi:uncharacterized pyridoxal phosphate-containing UPF0001 family protein